MIGFLTGLIIGRASKSSPEEREISRDRADYYYHECGTTSSLFIPLVPLYPGKGNWGKSVTDPDLNSNIGISLNEKPNEKTGWEYDS